MSFKNYSIDNTQKIIKSQEKKLTTQTTSTWKPQKTESIQKSVSPWNAPKIISTPKPPRVTLSDLGKNSGFNTLPDLNEGARIKNNIKNVIAQKEGELNVRHIFDDIDDKTVERNIPVAQSAINNSIRKGTLKKTQLEKLPNLLDGLTMFYDSAEKGKPKAEKLSRNAAYTEVVEKLKDIGIPKMQNPNLFANTKGSFNDVIAGIQKNYGIDTQTQKTSETIKSEDKAQDMYSSVLQNLPVDANIEVKPEDLLLMSKKIDNGALELQKLSNKVSFNYDDINEIFSRAEKFPGSLKKEERELLETVLKNTALPLQLRNKIQDVLAQPEVEANNEPKVEVNNELEAQNGDSLVIPTGIQLLGNNVNAAVIEKLEANKYNDGNISTFSESVSKTEPKGKSFYEDYKSRSQSNKPSLFNVFGKRFDLNVNEQMKPHKKFNLYYGDIWMGQPQTDLDVNDFSKDDLIGFYSKSDKYKRHQKALMNLHPIVDSAISEKDMQLSAEEHIKRFRDLARMSSTGQMKFVLEDMIDHFIDGNGADFSHEDLTKEVANHKVTKEFMSDFTNVLETQLQLYNGDVSAIIENGGLSRALRDAGVYLSQYDYSGTRNMVGGLTLAIHSWTESNVEIENYSIDKKGNYKGTLKFTFKDNFGLDIDDLPPDYAAISGFRSWFILQHYDKYEGKYKPFKTVVEIEYPISGKIEVKK